MCDSGKLEVCYEVGIVVKVEPESFESTHGSINFLAPSFIG